jgi:hypothetical protein
MNNLPALTTCETIEILVAVPAEAGTKGATRRATYSYVYNEPDDVFMDDQVADAVGAQLAAMRTWAIL